MREHITPGSPPGTPDRPDGKVIDGRGAVLLAGVQAAVVDARHHNAGRPLLALELTGRVNLKRRRTSTLYVFDEQGATAIVAQVLSLAFRAGIGERVAAAAQAAVERDAFKAALHHGTDSPYRQPRDPT